MAYGPYAGIEGYRRTVRYRNGAVVVVEKRNEKRRIQPRSKPLIADHT